MLPDTLTWQRPSFAIW